MGRDAELYPQPAESPAGHNLRAEAAVAAGRAEELRIAAAAALHDAARATALAELADARAACERTAAEQRAKAAEENARSRAEVASARAALKSDRLREEQLQRLDQEATQLRRDLAEARSALAEAVGRCGRLEGALLRRSTGPTVVERTIRDDSPVAVFQVPALDAWRRALLYLPARELALVSATCSDLRVEAQNDWLWELVCRETYPLADVKLAHCTNFRAAHISTLSAAALLRRERLLRQTSEHAAEKERMLTDVVDTLKPLKAAVPRSVLWTSQISEQQEDGKITSPLFNLGPLRNSYMEFYPDGDEDSDEGQCSLFLSLARGVEVEVYIWLNDVHVKTLRTAVGKKANPSLWGFSNLATAPKLHMVDVILEFHSLHHSGGRVPFDFYDVYL